MSSFTKLQEWLYSPKLNVVHVSIKILILNTSVSLIWVFSLTLAVVQLRLEFGWVGLESITLGRINCWISNYDDNTLLFDIDHVLATCYNKMSKGAIVNLWSRLALALWAHNPYFPFHPSSCQIKLSSSIHWVRSEKVREKKSLSLSQSLLSLSPFNILICL